MEAHASERWACCGDAIQIPAGSCPQDVPAVHGTIYEWRAIANEIERRAIT